METIIIVLFVASFFWFNANLDFFLCKWWLAVQMMISILTYQLWMDSGPALAALLFYIMSSSAYFGFSTTTKHPAKSLENPLFLSSTMRSTFSGLWFCVVFLFLDAPLLEACLVSIPWIILSACVWRIALVGIFQRNLKKRQRARGPGVNRSVDSTLRSLMGIASLYFYEDFPLEIILLNLANLLCVVSNRSSAGLGGYIAGLLYFFGISKGHHYLFPAFGVIVFLVWRFHDRTLFRPTGRINLWKFCFKYLWKMRSSIAFGLGHGTFLNVNSTMQGDFAKVKAQREGRSPGKIKVDLWAHSDAVQLFIEGGVVGVVLCIAAIAEFMIGADALLTSYAACWAVNSLVNFPNHLAAENFVTLLMLKLRYIGA